MRKVLLGVSALALAGCGGPLTTYVKSDTTTLGRVVVYRNGVAYFERTAHVEDDKLTLSVPADKVDDFLKSLSVVDAKTGEPAPVSYPTQHATESGTVDMSIDLQGRHSHDLKLTYVTEAPAWKPSYRVVLGDPKKVDLVGWAVVDNTSGEDWKSVKLGVGASSALAFRFDLRSVRVVERETLQSSDLFALAPPTGQSVYGGQPILTKKVLGDIGDDTLKRDAAEEVGGVALGAIASGYGGPAAAASATAAPAAPPPAGHHAPATKAAPARPASADPIAALARRVKSENGPVMIEGFAGPNDADKQAASLDRAQKLRERLVAQGVDASRLTAVGKGAQAGRGAGARLVEADAPPAPPVDAKDGSKPGPSGEPADPIGTSHFESEQAMTVARGTSAMISILHTPTEGEVVYLYDPTSARGNEQFAFRSLRLRNPTDSQLETGPVSVFGEGRFIGEGMAEPIPAHQVAFVPFALDRQIVVDHASADRDEIAKIVSVSRGVLQTQVQHIRKTTLTLHNRLADRAVVYVRHVVPAGYKSTKAPGTPEHVAGADLYRIEVDGLGKQEVTIEEATPIARAADLRTSDGMDLVRVYLTGSVMTGPLRASIEELVKTQKEIADGQQRVETLREQMGEYRQRMDELHAQIFTLRAVRTGGPLMASLEHKLQEMSDKLSRSTIDIVAVEEKMMLAKIRFQDGVADLSLEDEKDKEKTASST